MNLNLWGRGGAEWGSQLPEDKMGFVVEVGREGNGHGSQGLYRLGRR